MASKGIGGGLRRGPVDARTKAAMVAEGLVTVAEAARFLTVHISTMRDYIASGSISATRMGSRIAIPRRALISFAAALTREGRVA